MLVTHDLLGLFDRFTPKFVKKYANVHADRARAFAEYIADVKSHRFPGAEHSIEVPDEEWQTVLEAVNGDHLPLTTYQ